jgi:hypothetical protein
MAALLYKDFLIIAFGLFDKDKELWMPRVDVGWHSATGRGFHTINDSVDSLRRSPKLKPSVLKSPRRGLMSDVRR